MSPAANERAFQLFGIERYDKVIEDVRLHRRNEFLRVRFRSLNDDDGVRVGLLDLLDEIVPEVGKTGIQNNNPPFHVGL